MANKYCCIGEQLLQQKLRGSCYAVGVHCLPSAEHPTVRHPPETVKHVQTCSVLYAMWAHMTLPYAQYPLCIDMLHSGAVDVKPMITHRFGFSAQQIAAGFDCAVRSRETRAVKVMFNLG